MASSWPPVFEAFASPEADRSPQAKALTGGAALNGGLFAHKLEQDADHALRLGEALHVGQRGIQRHL